MCAEFAAKRKRPRFGEIFSVLSIFVFCSRIWCFCLNRKSVGCGFGRQKKGEKKTVGEEFLGRIRLFCLLFCVLRVVCTRHGIVLHKCCQVVTQPRLGFLQIGKAGDNTVCGICCFVQKAHGLIFLLCFSELCVKRCLQTRRGKREEVAVNDLPLVLVLAQSFSSTKSSSSNMFCANRFICILHVVKYSGRMFVFVFLFLFVDDQIRDLDFKECLSDGEECEREQWGKNSWEEFDCLDSILIRIWYSAFCRTLFRKSFDCVCMRDKKVL